MESRLVAPNRIRGLLTHVGGFLSLLMATVLLGGCEIPAQMVWSPDGSQAAYRVGNSAWLLNEQGTILRPLGSSMGGFAWTTDSKALYYAAVDEEMNPATPLDLRWLADGTKPTAASTQPTTQASTQPAIKPLPATPVPPGAAEEPGNSVAVNLLHDGKVDPLFHVAGQSIWHLQLSPDGQWIAVITGVNKSGDNDGPQENDLLVYSVKSSRLYLLSRFCGLGAAFTGPGRLAYVEPNGTDTVGQIVGHLVEVTLNDDAPQLDKTAFLDVVVSSTRWIEACDGGLLFTAEAISFPSRVTKATDPIFKLYRYTRGDRSLTPVAEDVGDLFDQSPDGKHILFVKHTQPMTPTTTAPAGDPPKPREELCLMNANGSNPQVLRDLDGYVGNPKPPMWPAWRGNDQIAFLAQPDTAQTVKVEDNERKVYDVIVYHLTDKGELDPVQTLSGDWAPELKPYSHIDQPKP